MDVHEIEHRRKYIADLRAAADFLEEHPEVPTPFAQQLGWFSSDQRRGAEAVKALSRAYPGKTEKRFDRDQFWARGGDLNTVYFQYGCHRSAVCERVVVGTKVIPAHVIPAQPETEVPEKVEEVVEWRCHPILAGGAA